MTKKKQKALDEFRVVAAEVIKAWPEFKNAILKLASATEVMDKAGFTDQEREELGKTDPLLRELLATMEDVIANIV